MGTANISALMAALRTGNDPTPFTDPHDWGGTLEEIYTAGQYSYTVSVALLSITNELSQLGVGPRSSGVIQGPPDLGPGWTVDNSTYQENNVYRYIVHSFDDALTGHVLYDSGSTDIADAMTLDDLYLLANNLVWCYHNLTSLMAYTNFTTGYYQYPDKFQPNSALELEYIPTYLPDIAENFTFFPQPSSLAFNYDRANTTGPVTNSSDLGWSNDPTRNAASIIFTPSNATSISVVSNNSPFLANGNPHMTLSAGPTMNTMAMWLYTANGTAEHTGTGVADTPVATGGLYGSFSKPAGLNIDKVGGNHPAESMTPKQVCVEFIRAVNTYTYLVRGYIEDHPASWGTPTISGFASGPTSDPLPGVTPVNTFIPEIRAWLRSYAQALSLADVITRVDFPGISDPIKNAIANTA